MGVPFNPYPQYRPTQQQQQSNTMAATAVSPSASRPVPCLEDAAQKTEELMQGFKQHAAEWAAAENRSSNSSSGQERPFLRTAGDGSTNTDAAYRRWMELSAGATTYTSRQHAN